MSQPIVSDTLLTPSQHEILDVVLDQMIPADAARNKPSATDVGVFEYIADQSPDSFQEIARQLDELDAQASTSHKMLYTELSRNLQDVTLNRLRDEDPRFLMDLALHTVACYYLDSRVLAAIGLPSRAPYPEGYTVQRGNLTLLDPVRDRGQIWRRA